jgi:hypothetical protein
VFQPGDRVEFLTAGGWTPAAFVRSIPPADEGGEALCVVASDDWPHHMIAPASRVRSAGGGDTPVVAATPPTA